MVNLKYVLGLVVCIALFVCGMLTQKQCATVRTISRVDTLRAKSDTVTRTATITQTRVNTRYVDREAPVVDNRTIDSLNRRLWEAFDQLAVYTYTVAEIDTTLTRRATVAGQEVFYRERWSASYAYPPHNRFTMISLSDPVPIQIDVPNCARGFWQRFGWGPYLGVGAAVDPNVPYGKIIAAPSVGVGVFFDVSK